MVSVTNEYGENLTDIFPKMFTFINMNDPHKSTKTFNEFLQSVDDISLLIDTSTKQVKMYTLKEFIIITIV